ncbi:MAG: N-acetylglucosaminyldiphosphoundecaprenol N-acetyl-beta-D-mannosaminyltransferase [Flavobacteriaceae bacterium]|jgi:N-acetylglucosaminyldiphosphoundecaprenol N-acetyl-beta-D-mannosaminyltransferase
MNLITNIFNEELEIILKQKGKVVINTINAHSYIVAKKDKDFKRALLKSDVLLPDGEGIVLMIRVLLKKKINKIAGADVHDFLLNHANKNNLKCFYLGSSNEVLNIIESKISVQYPNIIIKTLSPPFKDVFSDDENSEMYSSINDFSPDIIFIGMTAPKQEKWIDDNKEYLNFKFAASIGAVFDFIAKTKRRAPEWMIKVKLEWLFRALTSWRLTKRYLYSNPLFLIEILRLKFQKKLK